MNAPATNDLDIVVDPTPEQIETFAASLAGSFYVSREEVREALAVHLRHALHVATLPDHHGDPFDKILIAQAQIENLTLVSGDEQIARYPVTVAW